MQTALPPGIYSNEEVTYYSSLWNAADPENGELSGAKAAAFFYKSGLDRQVLKEVWQLANTRQAGSLNISDFFFAMRFISLAQSGRPMDRTVAAVPKANFSFALPRFKDFPYPVAAPVAAPAAVPAVASSGRYPNITPDEQAKYDMIFRQTDSNQDGYVEGKEAVDLFLKSKLDREQLRHIWNLSDIDCDRRLDHAEFCVAMHLVVGAANRNIPVPQKLPENLVPMSKRQYFPDYSFDDEPLMPAVHASAAAAQASSGYLNDTFGVPHTVNATSTGAASTAAASTSSFGDAKSSGLSAADAMAASLSEALADMLPSMNTPASKKLMSTIAVDKPAAKSAEKPASTVTTSTSSFTMSTAPSAPLSAVHSTTHSTTHSPASTIPEPTLGALSRGTVTPPQASAPAAPVAPVAQALHHTLDAISVAPEIKNTPTFSFSSTATESVRENTMEKRETSLLSRNLPETSFLRNQVSSLSETRRKEQDDLDALRAKVQEAEKEEKDLQALIQTLSSQIQEFQAKKADASRSLHEKSSNNGVLAGSLATIIEQLKKSQYNVQVQNIKALEQSKELLAKYNLLGSIHSAVTLVDQEVQMVVSNNGKVSSETESLTAVLEQSKAEEERLSQAVAQAQKNIDETDASVSQALATLRAKEEELQHKQKEHLETVRKNLEVQGSLLHSKSRVTALEYAYVQLKNSLYTTAAPSVASVPALISVVPSVVETAAVPVSVSVVNAAPVVVPAPPSPVAVEAPAPTPVQDFAVEPTIQTAQPEFTPVVDSAVDPSVDFPTIGEAATVLDVPSQPTSTFGDDFGISNAFDSDVPFGSEASVSAAASNDFDTGFAATSNASADFGIDFGADFGTDFKADFNTDFTSDVPVASDATFDGFGDMSASSAPVPSAPEANNFAAFETIDSFDFAANNNASASDDADISAFPDNQKSGAASSMPEPAVDAFGSDAAFEFNADPAFAAVDTSFGFSTDAPQKPVEDSTFGSDFNADFAGDFGDFGNEVESSRVEAPDTDWGF